MRRWGKLQASGVQPQTLQVVVVPRRLVEAVDHYIAIVQKHPLTIFEPLAPQRTTVDCLELFLHFLGQRHDVAPRCAGGDDEYVGDDKQRRHIEDDQAQAIFLF